MGVELVYDIGSQCDGNHRSIRGKISSSKLCMSCLQRNMVSIDARGLSYRSARDRKWIDQAQNHEVVTTFPSA
jgi:hypothetical protein